MTYTYEQAIESSKQYFGGEELPANIVVSKYLLRNEKDELVELNPADKHRRIAKELARIEAKKFKKPYTEDEIYSWLENYGYIIPQGSPMYGIGNISQYISVSNCFVVEPPVDSYGGIHKTDEQLTQISKRRGGVGTELSAIRPTNFPTRNSSRKSTGIIPFMERFSNSIREVGQDGRRGALMLTLDVLHPQIEDFINCKRDKKKVTGANISTRVRDEFLKAVEEGTDYRQRWPIDGKAKFERYVEAKRVWDAIIDAAWDNAEPGVLFWDNILRESPADCYAKFGFRTISTNPSLKEDTKVLTKNGVFNIKELENTNFEVLNIEGEWQEADCIKSGYNEQLIKITFQNGQCVYCTKEHKWPVLNSLGKVRNLHTGNVIKKTAIELKKRDKIYFPSYSQPINNLNCQFTNEDGFILGWNMGDGWISYHKNNKALQYGFIFNKEDLESGIGDRVLKYTNNLATTPSHLRQDHDTQSWSYVTTDKNVNEQMQKLGAKIKVDGISDEVWKGNHKFITGFIDGIFSSDGYIEFKPKLSKCRIVLVSAYKNLVHDIQKLLSFYGIKSNIIYSNKNGYNRYDLAIGGQFVKKFGNIFQLSNTNKQTKLNQILQLDDKDYANNRDYLVVKSVKTTEIYEDVYDITVHDDTRTFLTEAGMTGNCGELPLCILDSCRLLVLSLIKFVKNPFTRKAYFDYKSFYRFAQIAQRLMDDIIDLELECIERIIKKIKEDPESNEVKARELNMWREVHGKCVNGRRTGTGITALGDTLAALNVAYGSEESIKITDKIYQVLKFGAYRSSVDMAIELGPFPIWDDKLEEENPFLNRIADESIELNTSPDSWFDTVEGEEIIADMRRHGRRNIALLTTAPVGTVSNLIHLYEDIFGSTSGIEPAYLLEYDRFKKINPSDTGSRVDRVDDMGDKWQKFTVYHPGIRMWQRITGKTDVKESPYWGCCAQDLDWQQRVKLQAAAQRHVDHSISSTVNLPRDVSKEQVDKIFRTAWKSGLKGITIYRDGCRDGVLVDNKAIDKARIIHNDAPKRPKQLKCDIYHVKSLGVEYFVIVGLIGEQPYEIFAGKNGHISKKAKTGTLDKCNNGEYTLKCNETDEMINSVSKYITDDQEAICRLISTALRHGTEVKFLISQLDKTHGNLTGFAKSIGRTLKKYVKNGTEIKGKCEHCESKDMIFQEGCQTCKNCGFSKCG